MSNAGVARDNLYFADGKGRDGPGIQTLIDVEVTNRQTRHEIEATRLMAGVRAVWLGEGQTAAEVSVAIVDADEIWRLNREFLQHDYTTDVLSFCLECGPDGLDGEIVCSADMAASVAPNIGWSMADELLLYVIHGTLHLAGYDDQNPAAAALMRQKEREYLARLGVVMPVAALAAEMTGSMLAGREIAGLIHGEAQS